MNEWDNLPNAVHIDRVLASVKAKSGAWTKAYNATRVTARDSRRREIAKIRAWDIAWNAARGDAWNAAYDAATDAATASDSPIAARDAAWYAIAALVAYDDSAKYLDMPLDQLKMLYVLTEHPASSLLQPAVQAFAMEKEPA